MRNVYTPRMSYKRPPALIAYDERMPDGTTRLRVRDDRRREPSIRGQTANRFDGTPEEHERYIERRRRQASIVRR